MGVATREGGVDRNKDCLATDVQQVFVATRAGGVDRNTPITRTPTATCWSPPARVAWIETYPAARISLQVSVATREGGVDRNC